MSTEFINTLNINIIKEKDIEDIVNMLKDPEVYKYLNFAPSPEEIYRDYYISILNSIDNNKNSKNIVFIIRDNKNKFVGLGGLLSIPFCEDVLELGYQIKKEFWNKKIGTYICKYLIDYAFNILKARRLYADCFSDNIASKKVLLKNGFKLEGNLKDFYKKDGILHDRSIFGLLK